MTIRALVICPLIGAIVLTLALRRVQGRERRLIIAGFVAHVVASVALVLYHEASPGDMTVYRFYGVQIARALDLEFARFAPEVLKLALHIEPDLPFPVLLEGTSSGTMSAYTGILVFVLGDTPYGMCLLVSIFSFAGTMSLYGAVRARLEDRERLPALGALLFVPSATFWTSGIVKEAFLMAFMGFLIGAIHDVIARRRVVAVPGLIIGGVGVAMTKPYVVFPIVIATAAFLYAGRSRKMGVAYKVAAAIVAVGGLIGTSRLFPQFGFDNLGEAIATQQRNGVLVAEYAGSAVDIGDAQVQTLGGQLRFFPLGLVNSLTRPAIFDIRNPLTAVAALEMTVIVGGLFLLVYRNGFRTVVGEITRRPPLMFAALFVLSFAAAVGVTTTNLGTLSRYRVPMMPFYMGLVAVLRGRLARRVHTTQLAKETVSVRAVPKPLTREQKLRIARRRTASGRV